MGELNQKQKDIIQKLSSTDGQNPESIMQLHSCYKELTSKNLMQFFNCNIINCTSSTNTTNLLITYFNSKAQR